MLSTTTISLDLRLVQLAAFFSLFASAAGFAVSSQMQGPAPDTPLAASVQPWVANEV